MILNWHSAQFIPLHAIVRISKLGGTDWNNIDVTKEIELRDGVIAPDLDEENGRIKLTELYLKVPSGQLEPSSVTHAFLLDLMIVALMCSGFDWAWHKWDGTKFGEYMKSRRDIFEGKDYKDKMSILSAHGIEMPFEKVHVLSDIELDTLTMLVNSEDTKDSLGLVLGDIC